MNILFIYDKIVTNTKKYVKQSHYRPGQALGGSRRWKLPDFKTVVGKVVSFTHRPPLPPRKYSLVLIPVRD
jgi:hypothetical protein